MIRFLKNAVHSALAWFAAMWHGFPGKDMIVIGVTGTDGKTTTTHLIYHILQSCGKNVSMLSTVAAIIGAKSYDTGFHVTTPSAWQLQKFMKMAKQAGSTHFILEVTSHGLDQGRVNNASIDIAVITNISHEHLDYHKTFQNYRMTKAKILKGAEFSILNADDDQFGYLEKKAFGSIVTYGIQKKAQYSPVSYRFSTPLPGTFNTYNCLAAYAVADTLFVDRSCIVSSLATFTGVIGRMEKIPTKTSFQIFIDFAHKPNALTQALKTARTLTKRRIIVVFGCAGLRDSLKRPMMGEIAARLADDVVLTAEDPRTEDVRDIISQIANGCLKKNIQEAKRNDKKALSKREGKKYFWRIPDRQEGINFAIRKLAKRGDIVLLCGKGHESSMCYGTTEYPWNEKEAVQKALYGKIKASPFVF